LNTVCTYRSLASANQREHNEEAAVDCQAIQPQMNSLEPTLHDASGGLIFGKKSECPLRLF
jgi:hypothetical protein